MEQKPRGEVYGTHLGAVLWRGLEKAKRKGQVVWRWQETKALIEASD